MFIAVFATVRKLSLLRYSRIQFTPPIPINSIRITIKKCDTADSQRKYLINNAYFKLKCTSVLGARGGPVG